MTRDNIPADSPEQYYKRLIFLTLLDHFICQLKDRFTNNYLVMSKLQLLIPKYLNNNTNLKDLQEADYETFNAEVKV